MSITLRDRKELCKIFVDKLPPLTVAVDGSRRNLIVLSAFGLRMNYKLGGEGIDLVFNGESLLGKQTTIDLGAAKTHELVIHCGR